ncbi:MAG: phytoene/squalene synthase family protein [Flavobacteriales bacterium]|jgi:phytoene synthase
MNKKSLFDRVSYDCSRLTTHAYSTSFSMGIRTLGKRFRDPVYAIYGFVRFADEIVDTFHDFPKVELMARFRQDTELAIRDRISLNPILNSFQEVYHRYAIDWEVVDTFLKSMEMDLEETGYDRRGFESYILGSAEVVGLMCLRVFTEGNEAFYQQLKPYAMRLGAAFQKINFLRDLKADYQDLGRTYFPNLDMSSFSEREKMIIEREIDEDFKEAYKGILMLPRDARFGVYVAYTYYIRLFQKIRSLPSHRIMEERIRIPNQRKVALVLKSYVQHNLNLL